MNNVRVFVLAAAAGLLLGGSGAVLSGEEAKRQYYGPWAFYEHRGYHYRTLYYQPTPGAAYKYHYCILLDSNANYIYFYDPEKGKYWGRLDLQAKGDERFSLLRAEDQKPLVRDIPEAAFPKPDKMPALPGAQDGLTALPFPPEMPMPPP
jgi:hypothetical protein